MGDLEIDSVSAEAAASELAPLAAGSEHFDAGQVSSAGPDLGDAVTAVAQRLAAIEEAVDAQSTMAAIELRSAALQAQAADR